MARSFNASSDFARNANGIVTAAPLTLSCWGNSNTFSGARALMYVGNSSSVNGLNSFMLIKSGTPSILARTGDGSATSQSSIDFPGGIGEDFWFHAAAVFTSATSRTAYLDGVAGTTNTTSRTPSGIDRTSLGCFDGATQNNFYGGMLANSAIWNVALSADDIASLATGVCPLLVRPESLVAYWPFGGRYSPEIEMVSAFELTLTGTAYADNPRIQYPKRRRIAYNPTAAPATNYFDPYTTRVNSIVTCGVL